MRLNLAAPRSLANPSPITYLHSSCSGRKQLDPVRVGSKASGEGIRGIQLRRRRHSPGDAGQPEPHPNPRGRLCDCHMLSKGRDAQVGVEADCPCQESGLRVKTHSSTIQLNVDPQSQTSAIRERSYYYEPAAPKLVRFHQFVRIFSLLKPISPNSDKYNDLCSFQHILARKDGT